MKLLLLITACFITNLVAIPINTDTEDVTTVDQSSDNQSPLHELTAEMLAEPSDLGDNNGECFFYFK